MTRKKYVDLPGFPDYQVGRDGSVWSSKGIIKGKGRKGGWKRLSSHQNKLGYHHVGLSLSGKVKSYGVHALVLMGFVGPRPFKYHACHKDGNPSNNNLSNLYWGTSQENALDRHTHGTMPKREKHHRSGMLQSKVKEVMELKGKMPIQQVAKEYGVSMTLVWAMWEDVHLS